MRLLFPETIQTDRLRGWQIPTDYVDIYLPSKTNQLVLRQRTN